MIHFSLNGWSTTQTKFVCLLQPHNEPLIETNQKSVIRYAFGNNGLIKKLHCHVIALNYDSLNELDVKPDQDVDLIVTKATLPQQIDWLLHHSVINVRLSMRFALIGAGLGVISLFISLYTYKG